MASEWQEFSFGELCNITRGASPRPINDFLSSSGMPWIKIADATSSDSRFLNSTNECIKLEGVKSSVRVFPGDLILSNSATPGLPKFVAIDACIHDGWMLLRGFKGLEKRFAYWLLLNERKRLVAQGNGSVFTNLKTDILKLHRVKVPALETQVQIAKILDAIAEKIDLNRRINQTLEAMAQAIFKSWFVDFDPVKAKIAAIAEGSDPMRAAMSAISGKAEDELDALPPEQYEKLAATAALFPYEMVESELGETPNGWSHKTLAQLADKIGSGSTPRGGKEVYLEEGVALIRSQNVYDSLFVWDGLARISDDAATQLKGVTVQEDDVLLNITGASILRTCVVEPDALPARVNQHVAIIRAKVGVPPHFIHMHLLRPDIKNYLLGLNAGASREAITKAHIESLTLLTPSPELLAVFRTATTPLFQQVQRLARQMRVLGDLRDTLLPKLLSGELSVETLAETVVAV